MAVPYSPGGTQLFDQYNFQAAWEIIQTEKDPVLYDRFGINRRSFTNFLEEIGAKKAVVGNMTYSHFELDRRYPLIKATNGGAGSVGASVSFTLASDSDYAFDMNNPPYAGSANTNTTYNVRVNDIIALKPASGIVSYSTLIFAQVTAVSTNTFTAVPLDSTEAIPSVATASEIAIVGDAHGEGSNRPLPLDFKATEFTYNVQISKETYGWTDVANAMKTWVDVPGGGRRWVHQGEKSALANFLDRREINMLTNPGLANAVISNAQALAGTPMSMTVGLIPSILERGNTLNYSSLTGLTVADLEDHITVMDKQKAASQNLFAVGLDLRGQIDRELRDNFKNGGINYGMFNWDEAKKVSFGFDEFKLKGYSFALMTLDAFNERQSLGATGYGFPNEGFILPMNNIADPKTGETIPSARLRYLADKDGKSMEMETNFYNGKVSSSEGTAKEEIRYASYCGLETFALNRASYVKIG